MWKIQAELLKIGSYEDADDCCLVEHLLTGRVLYLRGDIKALKLWGKWAFDGCHAIVISKCTLKASFSAFSYLLHRLQSHQVICFYLFIYFTINVLFLNTVLWKWMLTRPWWYTNSWLILSTLNSRLVRNPSIHIFSNIQERNSQMDQGARGQLIQDYCCHPELTKHPNCLCYIWPKHSDGLCKLPLARRRVYIWGWSTG